MHIMLLLYNVANNFWRSLPRQEFYGFFFFNLSPPTPSFSVMQQSFCSAFGYRSSVLILISHNFNQLIRMPITRMHIMSVENEF